MLKTAVVIALLGVVSVFVLKRMIMIGFFQHYFKQHPGACRQVKGLEFGSEDFHTLSNGLTFVTSGILMPVFSPKYRDFLKNNNIKGRIYAVELNKPQVEAKELKIRPSKGWNLSAFRPHGISVLEDSKTSQHLLYVVSHPDQEEDRVEKFRYLPDSNELEHLKSFTSELFHMTNDLAVTGEDTFYISDCLYYKSHFMHVIETLFHLNYTSIVYFNGTGFSTVVKDVLGPNGVALSMDKRYLYVAFTFDKTINVYEIKTDSSLHLVQEVNVYALCDNLHLSQDGKSLFAGCHPIGIKVFNHIDDPSRSLAPSQVLNLPLKDGKIDENEITQTFYDHGDLISGSSIASIYNKKLLIGSVINKLAVCDLP